MEALFLLLKTQLSHLIMSRSSLLLHKEAAAAHLQVVALVLVEVLEVVVLVEMAVATLTPISSQELVGVALAAKAEVIFR